MQLALASAENSLGVQITKDLDADMYFSKDGEGNYMLAIFKPVRWGIAGTAQIAEDVVRLEINNDPRIVLISWLACAATHALQLARLNLTGYISHNSQLALSAMRFYSDVMEATLSSCPNFGP